MVSGQPALPPWGTGGFGSPRSAPPGTLSPLPDQPGGVQVLRAVSPSPLTSFLRALPWPFPESKQNPCHGLGPPGPGPWSPVWPRPWPLDRVLNEVGFLPLCLCTCRSVAWSILPHRCAVSPDSRLCPAISTGPCCLPCTVPRPPFLGSGAPSLQVSHHEQTEVSGAPSPPTRLSLPTGVEGFTSQALPWPGGGGGSRGLPPTHAAPVSCCSADRPGLGMGMRWLFLALDLFPSFIP